MIFVIFLEKEELDGTSILLDKPCMYEEVLISL
jgi:hypothetical protein